MSKLCFLILWLAVFAIFAPGALHGDSGSVAKKTAALEPSTPAKQKIVGSATKVIQRYERELKSVVTKFQGKKSPADLKKRDEALAQKVRRFFDFDELARLSLSIHWKQITAEQQKRFKDVFTELIERSYLHKSRNLVADYNIEYGKQTIQGRRATVASTIKKDDLDIEVVYELKKVPARGWVIYNVIFDSLNLLNNYKSQFNRIIGQKSFAELLRIMEDKLSKPLDTV